MKTKRKSEEFSLEIKQKSGEDLQKHKAKLNIKIKKKKKDLSRLKASDVLQEKIFRPVDIEKKFFHIEGKDKLLLKESDLQMLESVISQSNYNNNLEYTPYRYAKSLILPFFQNKLVEYSLLLNTYPIRPKIPITPRCTKLNLIDENVITSILKDNRGRYLSIKKMLEIFSRRTKINNISVETFRKFLKKRMNLRFRKVSCVSHKRKQNRFNVINHLFSKKYIQHIMENKSIIYIDESSFFGFNPKFRSWQKPNDNDIIEHYGRFKSFCLLGAIGEEGMIHYKIFQTTIKADDYISFLGELIDKINTKNESLDAFRRKTYVFFMDNAKTHTCKKTLEFLGKANVETIYAIPYCPELNPIELFFQDAKKEYHKTIFINR